MIWQQLRDFVQPTFDRPGLSKKSIQRITELVNGFTVKVMPLQTDQIQTRKVSTWSGHGCVGQDILHHH
jgi:hypothetical protein